MEISINDQPVDFTLEDENTLGQIYENVRTWLNNQGYFLISFQEDGKEMPLPLPPEMSGKGIHELSKLNFIVKPAVEISFDKYQTLYQYITLLGKAVQKENLALAEEILRDYPVIEEQLDILLKPSQAYQKNSDVLFLTTLLHESGLTEGKIINKDLAEKAVQLTEGFAAILRERLREYSDPIGEMAATGKALTDAVPKISEIPVLLQTGKDAEAMQTIIEFTEISQKLLRLYTVMKYTNNLDMSKELSQGGSLENFYQDFNGILKELDTAFEEKDSVLIGDLLEYEIAPRVETLVRMVEDLKG